MGLSWQTEKMKDATFSRSEADVQITHEVQQQDTKTKYKTRCKYEVRYAGQHYNSVQTDK